MSHRILSVILALLAAATIASAQAGHPVPETTTPIEGLTIAPDQAGVIELVPGGVATPTFTLANGGTSTLRLLAASFGGFGGGGREDGAPEAGDHAAPQRGTGGGGAEHGGAPSGGRSSEGPHAGGDANASDAQADAFRRSRAVRAIPMGDPEMTIEPNATATLAYEVTVAADALAGDYPVSVIVRDQDADRVSRTILTVRVAIPAQSAPPGEAAGASSASAPAGEAVNAVPGAGGLAIGAVAAAVALALNRRR